jgi:hypothetical protein
MQGFSDRRAVQFGKLEFVRLKKIPVAGIGADYWEQASLTPPSHVQKPSQFAQDCQRGNAF